MGVWLHVCTYKRSNVFWILLACWRSRYPACALEKIQIIMGRGGKGRGGNGRTAGFRRADEGPDKLLISKIPPPNQPCCNDGHPYEESTTLSCYISSEQPPQAFIRAPIPPFRDPRRFSVFSFFSVFRGPHPSPTPVPSKPTPCRHMHVHYMRQ